MGYHDYYHCQHSLNKITHNKTKQNKKIIKTFEWKDKLKKSKETERFFFSFARCKMLQKAQVERKKKTKEDKGAHLLRWRFGRGSH